MGFWSKSTSKAFAIGLLLLLGSVPARASFEFPFTSVRAASMGGVSPAGGEGAAAVFTNALGASNLQGMEGSFMYAKPFLGLEGGGLSAGAISLAFPSGLGAVSVGFAFFEAEGLKSEKTFALSWTHGIEGSGVQLAAGGRYLHHGYAPSGALNDPIFADGTSVGAFALDLGASVPLGGPFNLTVLGKNLNSPDVGLNSEDIVPMELRAGVSLSLEDLGVSSFGQIAVQRSEGGRGQGSVVPEVGLEKRLDQRGVFLRAGFNSREYTGGMGLDLGAFRFDYAFGLSREFSAGNAGSHRAGLTLRFGSGRSQKSDSGLGNWITGGGF